jgi:hypothetical protein
LESPANPPLYRTKDAARNRNDENTDNDVADVFGGNINNTNNNDNDNNQENNDVTAASDNDPHHPVVSPNVTMLSSWSPKPLDELPIRLHITQTEAKHSEYLQEGEIQIDPIRTYQGRASRVSINGCSVISACIVSNHMESHGGISAAQINSVIDTDCIPILSVIRNMLDQDDDDASPLTPSDVHSYMVDHKLLYQDKFSGTAGGNIADPAHLGALLNLLQGEPSKTTQYKSGATLLFREHVISIVKYPINANEAVYDMIDSLPTYEGSGSRTRCHSLDALKVHLEYYSTCKFSKSNIEHIECNLWDNAIAEFDPRVFQSFIWTDVPKPPPLPPPQRKTATFQQGVDDNDSDDDSDDDNTNEDDLDVDADEDDGDDDNDSDDNDNANSSSPSTNQFTNEDVLSDYELLRLKNIQRNQERFKKLGLDKFNACPSTPTQQKKKKRRIRRERVFLRLLLLFKHDLQKNE